KLIGPQTNAAYNNAQGEMAQRQQAHNEAIKNANEAAAKAGANAKGLDPTSAAARRCLELGGNTAACAGKSFLGGMMETFTGVDMGTEMDKVNRVGVFLSGMYQSPAAQTQVGFDLSGAHITGCGKLTADDRGYTLRRGGGGLQVVLSNQPAPIALGLR